MFTPFYDPTKSYEENFEQGPFGAFADGEIYPTGKTSGVDSEFDFLGFKVNSPFGIPAGPLINGKFVKAALDKGFDIVTYKTVRSEKHPCHPAPNVLSVEVDGDLTLEKAQGRLIATKNYQEPLSITNSFGVPSFDPKFWQKDINECVNYAKDGQVVIGAFQGTSREGQSVEDYINDFRVVARMLMNSGVKVLEVNLSCPNEGTSNLLCYDIERSAVVAKAIKEEAGDIPLIIKIAYMGEEVLMKFVEKLGNIVDGISAINTIPAEIVDEEGNQALPGDGRLRSGVCGAGIKWAGLDMTARLKKIRADLGYKFTIIGVGGVMNKQDFKEYRKASADIVMSATGAMWNPYLAKEIKESL